MQKRKKSQSGEARILKIERILNDIAYRQECFEYQRQVCRCAEISKKKIKHKVNSNTKQILERQQKSSSLPSSRAGKKQELNEWNNYVCVIFIKFTNVQRIR